MLSKRPRREPATHFIQDREGEVAPGTHPNNQVSPACVAPKASLYPLSDSTRIDFETRLSTRCGTTRADAPCGIGTPSWLHATTGPVLGALSRTRVAHTQRA